MTHLRIELSGITEEVSHSLISKLYELAISGDLDLSSNLMGRLNVSGAKQSWITYLTAQYPDLHITASKLYVDFVDPLVESRLLAFNIGDGTGVTLADMLNATIGTGDVFYNTAITSFDEFLYFTKPSFTSTCQNFCQRCRQLASITYPPQMQTVSVRSHALNSSLRTIDFRNTALTTISGSAFEGCISLESVYLPNTCTSIGGYGFADSSSLTTIDTSNVTTFEQDAFEKCTALLSIDLSSATSIGKEAFKGCTNLTTVTLNPALTTLDAACFKGCTSLSSIDFSNVTNFAGHCFMGCTQLGVGLNLDFNLDGKTFGSNAFRSTGYTTVTLHETTKHKISDFPGSDLYNAFGVTMPNLIKFDLSDTKLTYIGQLYSNNLTTLILPETYTGNASRGRDWGTRLLYSICLPLNPASVTKPDSYWGFAYMPANYAIYVPDSVYLNYVDAWITNSNDPLPSSRIKPISELPSSVTWYTKEHPSS